MPFVRRVSAGQPGVHCACWGLSGWGLGVHGGSWGVCEEGRGLVEAGRVSGESEDSVV